MDDLQRTVGPGKSGLDFVIGPANDVFADVNDDNTTDLKDLILALRLLSGQSVDIPNNTGDVNHEYKIGMEEVQAVLQVVGQ
ncbi:MAG: hypothetical protein GY702_26830 [Desulfobulbaceae bacterium]|nr:hypothetical protein [Desulfobulbaceae bacterium]